MAVYYKFKSAKYYDSITIDGHFILVINLKERIFESKRLGRGTDFDLIVTNAQTNEEYLDEAMLIPINTSVLIRRVPGLPRMPIVILPAESKVETKVEDDQLAKSNFMTADSSFEASDFDDEFGDDIYATIPEVTTRKSNILMRDSTPPNESDEDSKIKALIESSSFDLDCYDIHSERDGGHDRLRKRKRSSPDHNWEQDRYHNSHGHHRRSSHSHGSNRASQEPLDKDTPRSSLKRKREHHELEHDYDRSQERARVQEHDRESQHHDHCHRSKSDAAQAELDRKQKAGVLSSRISFPKEEPPKKPKLNHHTTTALPSLAAAMDYESSYDDERHFKRKPSRYEPSPLPREKWLGADEEAWMCRHNHGIMC